MRRPMTFVPTIALYPDADRQSSDYALLTPAREALDDSEKKATITELLRSQNVGALLISPEYKPDRGADTGGTLVYHFAPQPGRALTYTAIGHLGTQIDAVVGVIGYPDMLDQEAVRQLRRHYTAPANDPLEAILRQTGDKPTAAAPTPRAV